MLASGPQRIISVILAAGRGTRMQSPDLPKVCHPVLGRPVIARAIETYRRCGIEDHLIVVGAQAPQVMEAASRAGGNVSYCTQTAPKGTGNAARVAATKLKEMGYEGEVLVVAGDKIVDSKVLHRLKERSHELRNAMDFLVGKIQETSPQGRVITNERGEVLGILEEPDVARVNLLQELMSWCEENALSAETVMRLARKHFSREDKMARALRPIWGDLSQGREVDLNILAQRFASKDFVFQICGRPVSREIFDRARYSNLSIYLFQSDAFYFAVEQLSDDNAQGEEYLTDTVAILAQAGRRVGMVPVEDPHHVMAFNTPDELREIEKILAGREK